MSQPLLSIGMIVKNEERCLEKCLKALEPLRQTIPCELVIADTGSADKTREIAKKYADIFFDFKWVNDFSKARNAVMDKCSGIWFLTVDADEYLNSSIEEIVFFLTSDLSKKYLYASIVQRNYSFPNLSGAYEDFNAIRMVRMDTKKRYEGAIHESFPYIELELTHILINTIFDHDGYTELSPEHLKKKAERNLTILENELINDPNNLRCISQCLEACSPIKEKRIYYSKYALEKLKSAKKTDEYIDGFGPVCAKQAIKYMFLDKLDNICETANWIIKRFSNSYEVQIDVNFLCAVNLYELNDFNNCIKYSKSYLSAFKSYQKRSITPTYETFVSSITFANASHMHTILLTLSNALIKQGDYSEAAKHLKLFDLTIANPKNTNNWYSTLLIPEFSDTATDVADTVINNLLDVYKTNPDKTSDIYENTILTISKIFNCKNDFNYNIFANLEGTIGYCVKIANAKAKNELEQNLNKVTNWEEFMPLSLKKVIEFKVILPKDFYTLNSNRLNILSQALTEDAQTIVSHLCDYIIYFSKNNIFYETAFFYNTLLLILLSDRFLELSCENKSKVITTFCSVSENYLNTCFTTQLLSNDAALALISPHYLFSLYFTKAINSKEANPSQYVNLLRYILSFTPEAKNLIKHLFEELQNQEESKKQELIKNTTPELVDMAKQLKKLLASLPENSQELLNIKQSPMYKQIAFLIED